MLGSVQSATSSPRRVGAAPRFGKIDVETLSHGILRVTVSGEDKMYKPSAKLPDTMMIQLGVDPKDKDRLELSWPVYKRKKIKETDPVLRETVEREKVFEHWKRVYVEDKSRFAMLFDRIAEQQDTPNEALSQALMKANLSNCFKTEAQATANIMASHKNLTFNSILKKRERYEAGLRVFNIASPAVQKPLTKEQQDLYKRGIEQATLLLPGKIYRALEDVKNPAAHVEAVAKSVEAYGTQILEKMGVPQDLQPAALNQALDGARYQYQKYPQGFEFRHFETMPQTIAELQRWASPETETVKEVEVALTPLKQRTFRFRDLLPDFSDMAIPQAVFRIPAPAMFFAPHRQNFLAFRDGKPKG